MTKVKKLKVLHLTSLGKFLLYEAYALLLTCNWNRIRGISNSKRSQTTSG